MENEFPTRSMQPALAFDPTYAARPTGSLHAPVPSSPTAATRMRYRDG